MLFPYMLLILFTHTSVSVSVSITRSGSPMAGETYSLQCSATLNGTDSMLVTYLWLVGPSDNRQQLNNDSSVTVNSSTVQFSTLRTSHAGTYTCQITVGGLMAETTDTVEIGRKCIEYVIL